MAVAYDYILYFEENHGGPRYHKSKPHVRCKMSVLLKICAQVMST